MASIEAHAERMIYAHRKVVEVLREHGSQERVDAIERAVGDALTPTFNNPASLAAFQAQLLQGLAEVVERQIEESKPRPRGRPRKVEAVERAR